MRRTGAAFKACSSNCLFNSISNSSCQGYNCQTYSNSTVYNLILLNYMSVIKSCHGLCNSIKAITNLTITHPFIIHPRLGICQPNQLFSLRPRNMRNNKCSLNLRSSSQIPVLKIRYTSNTQQRAINKTTSNEKLNLIKLQVVNNITSVVFIICYDR